MVERGGIAQSLPVRSPGRWADGRVSALHSSAQPHSVNRSLLVGRLVGVGWTTGLNGEEFY